MNQTEQVIDVMRRNGGYATFSRLNSLIDFSTWKTKTPQASVRRIVQTHAEFFKIQAGLWALTEHKQDVLRRFQVEAKNPASEENFTHTYYQGLVVEIGNMKGWQTYVPPQDKNKKFLERPLGQLAPLTKIYEFTHQDILGRAKTVDVIWFNERKMPGAFFEVEHSTDIQNSLAKFFELQDFFARFHIVARAARKSQFDSLMQRSIFSPLRKRVEFVNYDALAWQYEQMSAVTTVI